MFTAGILFLLGIVAGIVILFLAACVMAVLIPVVGQLLKAVFPAQDPKLKYYS